MAKTLFKLLCCFFALQLSSQVLAAVDPVDFSQQPELEKRYRALTHTLRCPKCQNQSIGGSDAPIALDMRHKVEGLLREGKTNQEIEQFMIDRYGDYVTYDPPFKSRTYLLWFGPLIFLIIVVFGFWMTFRRKGDDVIYEDDEESLSEDDLNRTKGDQK